MRKYYRARWTAALAAFVIASVFAGCAETAARKAGAALQEQVHQAQAKLDQALAIMGPAPQALATPQLQLPDPRCLKLLEEAATQLTKAVSQYGSAPQPTLAQAQRTLAQASALKGQYESILAANYAAQAMPLLTNARVGLSGLADQVATVAFYQRLGQLDLSQMQAVAQSAQADVADAKAHLGQLNASQQEATSRSGQLQKENEQLEVEASTLRQQTAQPSTNSLEQALSKEAQLAKNNAELGELEQRSKRLDEQIKQTQGDMDVATHRGDLANQAIQARNTESQQLTEQVAKANKDLDQLRETASQTLADAGRSLGSFSEHLDAAVAAFESAASQFGRARGAQDTTGDSAQLEFNCGAILEQAFYVSQRCQGLLDQVEHQAAAMPSPPAGLQQARTLASRGDQFRKAALDHYAAAAELYSRPAPSGQGRLLQQARQAAALLGEYRLSEDKQLLQQASDLLEGATAEGSNASPDVKAIARMIQQAMNPTTAPAATQPTSAETPQEPPAEQPAAGQPVAAQPATGEAATTEQATAPAGEGEQPKPQYEDHDE